jgi:hypothetical protein
MEVKLGLRQAFEESVVHRIIRGIGERLLRRSGGRKAIVVAALLPVSFLTGCAAPSLAPAPPPPPTQLSDLVLDAAAPLIAVTLNGVPLRLRVDPAQWDVVELNPDAARRLGLTWQGQRDIQIGRVTLAGRWAETMLVLAGQVRPVVVAEHGRVAAIGADGIVGPDILPFATIRWRNPVAPSPNDSLVLPLTIGGPTGLTATPPGVPVAVRLRFTLMRERSEATAAAGSLLVQRYGGHFEGGESPLPVLFGVIRPARTLLFDRAPLLAGFRLRSIAVRIADFRGDNPLPADPVAAEEIVVLGKDHPQPAQAWVTLARDRLSRCAEILYRAEPRTLTLTCAFDR